MNRADSLLTVIVAAGPSDGGGFTPSNVTPGVAGFMVVFFLALATLLLIVDMTRRVRRMQARDRVLRRRQAEASQRDANETGSHDGGSPRSDVEN